MKTKKQQKTIQNILNTIPIFLAKTYKIVDNHEYKDIIGWTSNGKRFTIKNINKLTTQIFPKYFKHSNFASFVRQLNMYGFHKVKSDGQGHTFLHQSFKKDQIQKLLDIKRKIGNLSDIEQVNQSNMMVPLRRNQQSEFQKQLSVIKNKHEDLQGFVSILVDQNKQILMQNRTFVNKMSKMQEKYRNKLQTLMLLLLFGKAKNNNGQPFVLPQQFQNMLQSFNEVGNNNKFEIKQEMRKKKKSRSQLPLKMLKNVSEAEIQKTKYLEQDLKDDDIDLIQQIKQSKQQVNNQLDDQFGLIPSSPNHSYLSFSQLYDKHDNGQVSNFLQKFNSSDYEYLNEIDDSQDLKVSKI